ncbi:hypothetical protein QTI66_33045 [Variovorax sp. J22R133]|uniref:hypothetical protein n=1 Tax=Variovorax brevis TaxID=3053503 RepID=UPI002577B97F|nr:hypothetical protein [Variovorax sp. J22R133]MDM0116954.1 hypothetical protein [Variovorax sp. J22R133]
MIAAAINRDEPEVTPRAVASASPVDQSTLKLVALYAELGSACQTFTTGSACCCKCCSRQLLPFHVSTKDDAKRFPVRETVLSGHSIRVRASGMDPALAVVISLLAMVTASHPVP